MFSWSRFKTADARVLFDVACNRVLGRLKLKNLKTFLKKSISLEKLANGRYDFPVQPTATMVVDS